MKERIYKLLPHILQNCLVTLFDFIQYRKRHAAPYRSFKAYLKEADTYSYDDLIVKQNEYLISFLTYCKAHSPYYAEVLKNIEVRKGLKILEDIPIMSKENYRINIPKLVSGNKGQMYASKTGGTTGASMQVYFEWEDVAMRFSFLDTFRERFGYVFGEKTAWFSGKDILTSRDLRNSRYWKKDWLYNIKYYSTYHISEKTCQYYIDDLNKFKPAFIVGFPSSIVQIARFGLRNGFSLDYKIKAIFPTAETKVENEAKDMIDFFGGGVFDQYSSSEGACFITACEVGNLHFEMLSGIIEVVDDNNKPAQEGRMLITAFQTRGTPLIRYDIGDRMRWAAVSKCSCGRSTPLVEKLHGRINDYIYSRETGKCNLGNLSNCVKYVQGVRRFQIVQNSMDSIKVLVEKDASYSAKDEGKFLEELRYRLGNKIVILFDYVDEIPRERSGKFRIVKNNIKHLVRVQS